jgi:hypothetical protein
VVKQSKQSKTIGQIIRACFDEVLSLILRWRFIIPFGVNQFASVLFTFMLSRMPITLVVPVVNSLTFVTTCLAGKFICNERLDISFHLLFGVFCVILGVTACIFS